MKHKTIKIANYNPNIINIVNHSMALNSDNFGVCGGEKRKDFWCCVRLLCYWSVNGKLIN